MLEEPLSRYSSFRIGGPAEIFFKAQTVSDLIAAFQTADKLSIPVFVLGGGTNLLVADSGFRGLVIKNETNNIKLLAVKGRKITSLPADDTAQKIYLEADSGVSVNRLVRFTLDAGFAGLEYFLGQPGTVGGAMYINAHNMKKGVFFGDRIFQAKIMKTDGAVKTVPVDYFKFGYDQSIIQKTKDLVLSVGLELARDNREKLWKLAQETLQYRQKTQPAGVFSSGCTFRNIKKSEAVKLATPNYTTSAGFLLDSLGLKGTKIGNAMFSPHHANFIIHRGGAKASDVLELIKLAKDKVKEKFGIDLHEEIVLVGNF